MKAVVVEEFGSVPSVREVAVPAVAPQAVLLRVEATGLCRSDWHGWSGHDPDIVLPHVPGHELAGTVVEVGSEVREVHPGDRVTAPFVVACGHCRECIEGNEQTCLEQQQPGFSYWGSFAEYVVIPWADHNIVTLPDGVDFVTAAGLGCRFATAYRGIRQVARVVEGEWVLVLGCGGVGLSAVMIAAAAGARVVAVDTNPDALELAAQFGASHTVLAYPETAPGSLDLLGSQIAEITGGGADVAVEALGSASLVARGLQALRPRGRLIQIGLLPGSTTVPMGALIGKELQWLGSHGMAARHYPEMLSEIASGALDPSRLVRHEIGLADVPEALARFDGSQLAGVTVIRPHRPSDQSDRGEE